MNMAYSFIKEEVMEVEDSQFYNFDDPLKGEFVVTKDMRDFGKT